MATLKDNIVGSFSMKYSSCSTAAKDVDSFELDAALLSSLLQPVITRNVQLMPNKHFHMPSC